MDAEIIVVDNNSEDDSCQMVKMLFPKVKLIENKKNLGFSKGNNVGVRHAQGEYICILNPDTVVAEDTFQELLKLHESKGNLGVVGCRLIDGNGRFLPESKRNIPVVKAAFKKLMGNSMYYYANHLNENGEGEVEILVGAFMFLKKSVYSEIGGFDEDYFMYGEDIDLSYKVLKSGYKNYYFGGATIIHFKGESTLKDKNYARRFYGAMQIFYKKHFKRNFLFDAFVWFGIRMAYLSRRVSVKHNEEVIRYVLVGDKVRKNMQSALKKDLVLNADIENYESNDELIFDANYITYKEIIARMDNFSNSERLTFKILPSNSNFILGSNSSASRGEIIEF